MDKIELYVNKKKKNLKKQNFLKIEGNFNYYLTIEITGQPGTINSNIKIQTFAEKNRKVITKSNFKWFKKQKDKDTKNIINKTNFLNLDANIYNKTILTKVTPCQENFFGECRIYYGKINIDKMTKKKYDDILREDYLELEVEGLIVNESSKFENLEIYKNIIKASDQNLQVVEELGFNANCEVRSEIDNFLKVKIFFYDRKNSEITIGLKNVIDKNLCLLFLKRKIDIVKHQKPINLKRLSPLENFSDQSMVRNIQIVNDSNSSLLSLNNIISRNNPLKQIINTSKNTSQNKIKNQRSVSLDNKFKKNIQQSFSDNKDQSILNRYLNRNNKVNIFGEDKKNPVLKNEIRIYSSNNSKINIKSHTSANFYKFEKNLKTNNPNIIYSNKNESLNYKNSPNYYSNKNIQFHTDKTNSPINMSPNTTNFDRSNKIINKYNSINKKKQNILNFNINKKLNSKNTSAKKEKYQSQNIINSNSNQKNYNLNQNQKDKNSINANKMLNFKINKNKSESIPQMEINRSNNLLLERMLNSQNKDLEENKIKIEDLESKNNIYQKELKRLKFANEGLKREIMFMQKTKKNNDKNENLLSEEKEILFKKQFNVLNEKYREVKIKFDQLSNECLEKNNLLIEKENEFNELEILKYDLESKNRNFEERITKLGNDNEYFGKKNTLLELDLEKSKMEIEKIRKLENDLKDKDIDVDNYQNHCDFLEKEKNLLISENEELKNIIEKKEDKILDFENIINEKNNFLKLEKIKQNELLENIKNLRNQITEKDYIIDDKLNKNDLEEELIVLKKKYYILTDEKNDLKHINEDIENENINLQKKIIDLDTKLKEKEISEMTETNQEIDLLSNEIKNLKFDKKDLLAKLDINMEEHKLLKNKISNFEQDLNLTKSEKKELIKEINILKKKIEIEKEMKNPIENESNDLIEDLKDQLKDKEESYFEYQDNMTKLREDIFNLREDKFELNEKLNTAINKLKNYRNVKQKFEDSILSKENEILDLKRKINTNEIDNIREVKKENNFDNEKFLKLKIKISEYKNKLQNEKENVKNLKNLLKEKETNSILLQKEIKTLKTKKPLTFSFSKSVINNNLNSDENSEISELQRKMNIKDSKIISMQKELNARSSRLDELINYIKNSSKSDSKNLLIRISQELKMIKKEKEDLEERYYELKDKQLFGDDHFLDNIEIDDVKEKLIAALSFYRIDLIEEFQYKEVDDIIIKIKELLKLLKDSEVSLEKKNFVLLETNNLLKKYEEDRIEKEKIIAGLEEEKETLLYSMN